MKAVVLCGGRGERLMPMTDRRPAALLRLCGKEILLFTLEMLEKAGFEEAVLAVGYGSEQVERLLDEKYSGKIKLHMINTAGKSTAQAVRTAMCDETEILAVECNCICTHPLDEIIKVHLSHDTFCTALAYDTENKPAGINERFFGLVDEKLKGSFLRKGGVYKGELLDPDDHDFTSDRNLFNYQAKIIKQLADREPAVIVGR